MCVDSEQYNFTQVETHCGVHHSSYACYVSLGSPPAAGDHLSTSLTHIFHFVELPQEVRIAFYKNNSTGPLSLYHALNNINVLMKIQKHCFVVSNQLSSVW